MRRKIRRRYDSNNRLLNIIPVLIFVILLMGSKECFVLGAETIPVTDSCLDLHISPDDLLTLAPEQSLRLTIENIQYLLSETLTVGTYEVFVTYLGGLEIERERNKVLSNKVTFDVLKNNSEVRK